MNRQNALVKAVLGSALALVLAAGFTTQARAASGDMTVGRRYLALAMRPALAKVYGAPVINSDMIRFHLQATAVRLASSTTATVDKARFDVEPATMEIPLAGDEARFDAEPETMEIPDQGQASP